MPASILALLEGSARDGAGNEQLVPDGIGKGCTLFRGTTQQLEQELLTDSLCCRARGDAVSGALASDASWPEQLAANSTALQPSKHHTNSVQYP